MSKLAVKGHASGTGTVTLEAPNTSTDRTITLPDGDVILGAATPSITDNGNATAITINSSEQVTISNSNSADNTLTIEALNANGNEANVKLAGDVSGAGMGSGEVAGSIQYYNNADHIASISAMRDEGDEGQLSFKTRDTSDASPVERLRVTKDGRGLSQFTAKAWCRFNGSTATINDSHNVSTLSDYEAGKIGVNFSNNMANANYAACVTGFNSYGGNSGIDDPSVSRVTAVTSSSSAYADASRISVIVFGD